MRATSDWPGEDPAAIALAARIVMLSAASRTCSLGSCSESQRRLLVHVASATQQSHVQGAPFADFLELAQQRFEVLARTTERDGDYEATLRDVAAALPVDLVGEIYDRLVELAAQEYERPLGPALSRRVLPLGDAQRAFAVRGGVRRGSNVVELLLYSTGYDLAALALTPRILAHELMCHIAAGHTDAWQDTPEPDVRAYFSDGFMDRATWRLLMLWLEAGELRHPTPVGQLSLQELAYHALRPTAFKAGMAAFDDCVVKTTECVCKPSSVTPAERARLRAESEYASIHAALRMNTCQSTITRKDWFVHDARTEETGMAARFAGVAAHDDDPELVLETVHHD